MCVCVCDSINFYDRALGRRVKNSSKVKAFFVINGMRGRRREWFLLCVFVYHIAPRVSKVHASTGSGICICTLEFVWRVLRDPNVLQVRAEFSCIMTVAQRGETKMFYINDSFVAHVAYLWAV